MQQNADRIKVENETGMVSEEDPRCVDSNDTDIPSALSVQETVPEVSLFLFFVSTYHHCRCHHHNSSSSSPGFVCVFTHTSVYNVTFSLKNAHDNFDDIFRIF